jgi:hypothetical protein
MTMDAAAADPARLAGQLVEANAFLTLATVGADGSPWATPVWFAARGLDEFIWASKPGARHSRNIAADPRVSLVVFDSSATPGQGSGFYASARAEQVEERFDDAFALYNRASIAQGLREWDPAKLRDGARHRLYRAIVDEAFVLDDHDERLRVR